MALYANIMLFSLCRQGTAPCCLRMNPDSSLVKRCFALFCFLIPLIRYVVLSSYYLFETLFLLKKGF